MTYQKYRKNKIQIFQFYEELWTTLLEHYGFGIFVSTTCLPKNLITNKYNDYLYLKCSDCKKEWKIKYS